MKQSRIIKWGFKSVALIIISLLVLEVSGRIYAMIKLGADYGAFGTKLNTSKLEGEQHLSAVENLLTYSKYKPHSEKKDTDEKNRIFKFTTNNIGFRGPDVNHEKESNVVRIVCLGGSSTFGYGNRDKETYPYFLDSLLNVFVVNTACKNMDRIEVINLGIPFQTSDRIFNLFTVEALPLSPDIVTFYEGYNDASLDIFGLTRPKENPPNWFDQLLYDFGKRIIFVKFYKEWLLKNGLKFNKNEFETFKKGRSDFFIENVSKIKDKCTELCIPFILVTQQSQSWMLSEKQLKQTSYQTEAEMIRSKLQHSRIKYREACFLVHNEIMNRARIWADTNKVIVVEGIYALDTIRNEIRNFVHLKPKANLVLAKVIKSKVAEILKCQCSEEVFKNETAGIVLCKKANSYSIH